MPAGGTCVTSFERRLAPDEVRVYHHALQVGRPLPAMPLFLEAGLHVEVALEATYLEAFEALPGPDQDRVR